MRENRYRSGDTGLIANNTTANTPRPIIYWPIANTSGLEAVMRVLHVKESGEADKNLELLFQLVTVAFGGEPANGQDMATLGAGAGLAAPCDPNNGRAAVVGASTHIKVSSNGGTKFADAAVTAVRTVGRWDFHTSNGLWLNRWDLEGVIWQKNETLVGIISHGSGSAAPLLNVYAEHEE